MGKKGTWFSAVKKAFRSPSKDKEKDSARSVAKIDHLPQVEVAVKPKSRRRWSFGKSSHQPDHPKEVSAKAEDLMYNGLLSRRTEPDMSQFIINHAPVIVAPAYTYADFAAIRIQAAFRAYLARRALQALKGLVRLQALVRGHTVRRQATITLRCMQALVRVQARVRARRVRMSEEGQAVQRQIQERRLLECRPRRSTDGGWDDSTQTPEEIQAKILSKQEAALKRERALAYAFSHQLWKADPSQTSQLYIDCEPDKPHWGWSWLERWMAARPWENRVFDTTSVSKDVFDSYSVKSTDHIPTKAPEPRPNSRQQSSTSSHQGQVPSSSATKSHEPRPAVSAPRHNHSHSHGQNFYKSPMMRASSQGGAPTYKLSTPVLIRSASPRSSVRREDIEEGASTVSMVSGPRYSTRSVVDEESLASSQASVPNYMQATQSAKAKVRSHSTPKQRPGTPEKEVSSKIKRLSLPGSESVNGSAPVLRPFRLTPYAQRSPSLRTTDQRSEGEATPASSEVSGARGLYR